VLTPGDDYPIHQTSEPVAHPATSDPNHYDRYFFNGSTPDGSLFFGVALGLYPNRQVIDGAFSVVADGQQVSVHASGRCPPDRETSVGPITVEVVQPLRALRIRVDAAAHGLRADLTFTARTRPVEEPRFVRRDGVRVAFDYTRLTQWGGWDGWVEVDGRRAAVSPEQVRGCRDRSWGVRPVGERAGGAPGPPPQFFWLWAPVGFDDLCVHFATNEEADGTPWHRSGFLVPVGDDEPEAVAASAHRVEWRRGTRRAARAEIDLVRADGEAMTLRLEPFVELQMAGLGYLHRDWGHGVWKGEAAEAGERWAVPVADPLAFDRLHIQALCRATLGERVGLGVLEQLVIGPYGPGGFSGLADGAP
jgi:hypothetical protein